MKNESVIEHYSTQEIGIKQDFRYFKEGKGEEKSFLRAKFYLIKHHTAYIRLQEIFVLFHGICDVVFWRWTYIAKGMLNETLFLVVVLFNLELLKFLHSIAIILYLVLKTEKRNKFQSLADSMKTKINGFLCKQLIIGFLFYVWIRFHTQFIYPYHLVHSRKKL